ncbi:MAG TPA: HD domain-containing protein [Desulfobulbaceae bacterium]|nr:HD domain-containing protein [Desulfobulbaceae bacterium]
MSESCVEAAGSELTGLLAELNREESSRLSPLACLSRDGLRGQPEKRRDYRQPFAQDCDRILHSRCYTRYIDKTQVFSLVDNDHISHRVLHVQIVSRIARTIGRFLRLNEDLIEAIALGHDIGHPPFGHEGERILDTLCREHGLDGFAHNIQSVQFLDRVERKGQGWNLCLQVLDGILCHDGEVHVTRLAPCRDKNFMTFAREIRQKGRDPLLCLTPMTLEGCVVRMSDTIAYIGRDIEDAIELKLIDRSEIPPVCAEKLGTTNGTIVYTLVTDLISHSRHVRDTASGTDRDYIGFGSEISDLLLELKSFNSERIYHNPAFKPDFVLIRACYRTLFEYYMNKIKDEKKGENAGGDLFPSMTAQYFETHSSAAVVRDYLSGMTDEFFLKQAGMIGCRVPERTC